MPKDIHKKFGKQIKFLRNQHGFTQEELAFKAGISTKYLQNLESKSPKVASIATIAKLAKAFSIPAWKILQFKE